MSFHPILKRVIFKVKNITKVDDYLHVPDCLEMVICVTLGLLCILVGAVF